MSRQLLVCALVGLSFAVPGQAANFVYSGAVDTIDGVFGVLLPLGSTVHGTFGFDVPGPNQTTDDPAALLFAEIFAIPGGASNGFCFVYVIGCVGSGSAKVPVAAVTAFSVSFNAAGFPSAGFIELFAFAPTDPALWLVFDLSNDLFVLDGTPGIGMVSGSGSFQQQVVPLPAAVWLLACALLVLSGFHKANGAGHSLI